MTATRHRHPRALTELAQRLRTLAHDEAANAGSTIHRFAVRQPAPLVIEEVEGDLVLEDGDPDFTVGDGLRQHIARYGLAGGDQIIVAHAGDEWHALDAASTSTPEGGSLAAGSYTLTGDTPTRTLDAATATTKDVANVLATLIRDLGVRDGRSRLRTDPGG